MDDLARREDFVDEKIRVSVNIRYTVIKGSDRGDPTSFSGCH